MKIVIVGAGIGGLTTAVALKQLGLTDVTVLEQAEEFREVGAAVQVSNNGTRVLTHYGLGDALAEHGCLSEGELYLDLETDEEIYLCRAGQWGAEYYGVPYYQILRTTLHQLLRESIPADWVKRSARVAAVRSVDECPVVELEDGTELGADLVIGADGLRSTVREFVSPGTVAEYSGFISWRTLIPMDRIRDLEFHQTCYDWIGPDRVVAVYQSSPDLLNFLANVPVEDPRPESWSNTDGAEELRKALAHASPTIQRLIDEVDNLFVTGLFDRPVLDTFSRDSVVLMGDAAHPFLPYLASGATQAMEDAHVLATMLARAEAGEQPLGSALQEYEMRRRLRVDKVQRISREMLRLSHVTQRADLEKRNDRLKAAQLEDPNGGDMRGWIWGYDVIADTERDLESALSLQALENSIWSGERFRWTVPA
jgi:salicylate hydroxylase